MNVRVHNWPIFLCLFIAFCFFHWVLIRVRWRPSTGGIPREVLFRRRDEAVRARKGGPGYPGGGYACVSMPMFLSRLCVFLRGYGYIFLMGLSIAFDEEGGGEAI